MDEKLYLILENGMIFQGKAFGSPGEISGEVVFTTSMVGYLETLTDPSYYGQIVVQTFPLIGNYGVIPQDFESRKPFLKAYIVRDWCQEPSNFRNQGDLDTFLKQQNIIGLYGIDTRALTKIVRERGVMNGRISRTIPDDLQPIISELKEYTIIDAVKSTTCDEFETFEPADGCEDAHKHVVLYDYGVKRNICRELQKMGCRVTVVPGNTPAEEVIAMKPDGIMLSNGPGDPEENTEIINELKILYDSGIPIMGVCLGHQLLALCQGGSTVKMKYGHRGANQPVKRLSDSRIYISSQNHGYCVVGDSLPAHAKVSFQNVNDGTCEGVQYLNRPVFSVQFHPEACGGPHDTAFLFREFLKIMKGDSDNAIK